MKNLSIAVPHGIRGAGLGNEIIPLAKAMLAAQAIDGLFVGPAWSSSKYKLPQLLGIPGRRVHTATALRAAPGTTVTARLYRETGVSDYGKAVSQLASNGRLRGQVTRHEGMWGGYLAIREARADLTRLLSMNSAVSQFLSSKEPASNSALTVGLHVRRGDFRLSATQTGQFNLGLPLNWYLGVMRSLAEVIPSVRFAVCSDADAVDLSALWTDPDLHVTLVRGRGPSAPLQELMYLTRCDLLVCSVSSFSMLAGFLSNRPYVWFGPQLNSENGRLYIWNDSDAMRARQSAHAEHTAGRSTRALVANSDGSILGGSSRVASALNATTFSPASDLLYYGGVAIDNLDAS